jgi:hypothetical protein
MFSHKIFRACKRAADSFHTVQFKFMHIAQVQYLWAIGHVLYCSVFRALSKLKIRECLIVFGEHYYFTSLASSQRVLNDLKRNRLLAAIWFGSSHTPTPSSVTKLDWRHTGRLRKRDGMGGGRRHSGQSYDRENQAWSSINHSILSAWVDLKSSVNNFPCPLCVTLLTYTEDLHVLYSN